MDREAQRALVVKILSQNYCPQCEAGEGLVLKSETPEHRRYVNCQECQFVIIPHYYDGYYTWTLGERFK